MNPFRLRVGPRSGPRARPRALEQLLASVHLAPRQSAKSLTLWPLLRPRGGRAASPAVPLAQALEDGFVSLETAGSEHLALASRAPDPVLVLFGEELALERQTLAPSASVLVPPRSELALPVHRTPPARRSLGLSRAFRALPGQLGFAAARGDELVGLELVSPPELFARCFATLLQLYASEAPEPAEARADRAAQDLGFDAPEPFLEALLGAEALPRETPGLGSELWLAGEGVSGCALVAGSVLHLLAFPTREAGGVLA